MSQAGSMSKRRRTLGWLLLLSGPLVIAYGYSTLPTQSACQSINSIVGPGTATCPTTPPAGYFVAGALLALAGLAFLAPWLLRWLSGK